MGSDIFAIRTVLDSSCVLQVRLKWNWKGIRNDDRVTDDDNFLLVVKYFGVWFGFEFELNV